MMIHHIYRLSGLVRPLILILALGTGSCFGKIDPIPEYYMETSSGIFAPVKAEDASLSPDGKYLAFSEKDGDRLYISCIDIDNPGKLLGKAIIGTDMVATPHLQIQRKERTPARIIWMRWVTPEILLLETNQYFRGGAGAIASLHVNDWKGELVLDPSEMRRVGRLHRGGFRWTNVRFAPLMSNYFALAAEGYYFRAMDPWTRLKVLDLNPGNEEEVFLQFGYDQDFDLYALNADTGKLRFVRREQAVSLRQVLFNRQHQAGIIIPWSSRSRFPFHYALRGESGLKKWRPLTEALELSEEQPFALTRENFLGTRAIPLGFNEEANRLFFATNQDRDTYAIRSLNLDDGNVSGILLQDKDYDLVDIVTSLFPNRESLVYDRFTREFIGIRYPAEYNTALWLEEDLKDLQTLLESRYPNQSVEILEWDEDRDRYLVRTYGPADRGSIHLFQIQGTELVELVRVLDHHEAQTTSALARFSYPLQDGGNIFGWLFLPEMPSGEKAPLVVRYPQAPWARVQPRYDPLREYLVQSGYAVLEFNGRGAPGFGKAHVALIEQGYEFQQADDLVYLLGKLAPDHPVDSDHFFLLGEMLGGYGALRTAQAYPDLFKAVATITSPLDPLDWLEMERWSPPRDGIGSHLLQQYYAKSADRNAESLRKYPEQVTIPVLFFAGRDDRKFHSYQMYFNTTRKINASNGDAQLVELHPDYFRGLPEATAEVYARITQFMDDRRIDSSTVAID